MVHFQISISIKGQSFIQFRTVSGIEIMKFRGTENDAVVEMLEKTSLWSGLSKKDLKLIVKLSKERKYETGDIIVRKGEGGVGFYLVLEGSVEVRSDGTALSRLGPGQFFGEMSVLDNQPRSADVVAVGPLRCLTLSAWTFNGLISNNPRIALKMLQEFARRLRSADLALSD
jgi:CRP/FNR family cyclic AMP-dependent transcriptional regulator